MHEIRILHDGVTTRFPLATGSRWRIGRDPHCEIQVVDRRISGEHAEIVIDTHGVTIRRTTGRRPIELQGAMVESALIKSGCTFTIGHTEFTLVTVENGMNLLDTQAVLSETWAGSSARLMPPPAAPATAAGTSEAQAPRPGSSPVPGRTSADAPNRSDSSRIIPPADSGLHPAVAAPGAPMRLLAQLVSLLSKTADRSALASSVLELVCQRLKATRALLARVQGSDALDVIATHGIPGDAEAHSLISTTVLKQILEARQAVFIGNTAKSGTALSLQASVVRNHIQAVACTPVFNSRGELTAVLYVDNQDRPAEFSAQDAELLIWVGQIYSLLEENLEMRRRLEAEVSELKAGAISGVQMVAEAPEMTQLLERVKKAAASEASVLILGESGSGKEMIARLIHTQSPRNEARFVARNCAAIPETLFESEMFGHKKGAFTGADGDRKGAFQEADGGTLFLDEIGDLDVQLQTKLLRAIQERVIRPVGSDKEVPVNVRIVCATNRDLREACKTRAFREDLFYRISTVTVQVPALRERKEDILPLSRHFVRVLSGMSRTLSAPAEEKLMSYGWPGNVRELRAILEQACIFAARNEITADEINLPVSSAGRIELGSLSMADVERRHILHVLHTVGGNRTEAAKLLGLARSTLVLKLQAYQTQGFDVPKIGDDRKS